MITKFWFRLALLLLASFTITSCYDKEQDEGTRLQHDRDNSSEIEEPGKEQGKISSITRFIGKTITHPIGTAKSAVGSIHDKIKTSIGLEKANEPAGKEIEQKEAEKEEEPQPTKESGKLDFFGRDAVRAVGKAISKVSDTADKIKTKFETTVGLDLTLGKGKNESEFRKQVQAIYPGTKWCGGGNKARSEDDLGFFASTDACCREHDNCPNAIPAGEVKFDLHNSGLFTRSHCECDTKFYKCLKDANSIIAKKIGFTYFTVLGPQCFKEDYPISECKKKDGERCEEYLSDESKARMYQWFDAPNF